ncbi:MAG: inositol monophosphatase family protein [Candidatus Omnitrophota bacterium]
MEELAKIKEVAVSVAQEAGNYALQRMGHLKQVSQKSGRTDLVTDDDKKREEILIGRIKKDFPAHSILAEESGEYSREAAHRWVIDPLDGTTNYAHSFPVFCVSIGVMLNDKVKLGVVYDPSREELFMAEDGKGAFLNGKKIKVSGTKALQDSLVVTGFAYNIQGKIANVEYFKKMLEITQAVRRLGSAALDLCYVACGRFDGFWELGLNPWDMAAGQLVVKEAGGIVTTMRGGPFDIFKKDITATNGIIHDEMLKGMIH